MDHRFMAGLAWFLGVRALGAEIVRAGSDDILILFGCREITADLENHRKDLVRTKLRVAP